MSDENTTTDPELAAVTTASEHLSDADVAALVLSETGREAVDMSRDDMLFVLAHGWPPVDEIAWLADLDKPALLKVAADRDIKVTKSWGAPRLLEAITAELTARQVAAGDPPAQTPPAGDPPAPEPAVPVEGAQYRARHEFRYQFEHTTLSFVPGQVIDEHLVAQLVREGAPIDAVGT